MFRPSPTFTLLIIAIATVASIDSFAQWPKELKAASGAVITIYQPQPESLKGDKLEGRAAFSAQEVGAKDPLFGVFWYSATMNTNRDDRSMSLQRLVVRDVKLPGVGDSAKFKKLKSLLETEIPKWELTGSFEEITSSIEREHILATGDFKHDPPVIHYVTQPTMLVLIDGEPKVQEDKELKVRRVVNTAFLIVENGEGAEYYLYGGDFWYVSKSIKEGYQYIVKLPKKIATLDKELKSKQGESTIPPNVAAPNVLVSTVPAELIQSKGEAQYSNIDSTSLLFVSNTNDDIFKHVDDQMFYILISGRWYKSPKLDGQWAYTPSDQLPPDFAKIPEGSVKDNVLASVAGTNASLQAIRDAQVPQTASVDRKTAKCSVVYDGEPKFENIPGTSLQRALNTKNTILKSGDKYYCVLDGIWFVATSANGPWKVSDVRPKDVDKIPSSSPAYNVRFVEIYDSTADVVYVGYTPGYMGCYVYGPTVVYGTGYHYQSWYGPNYYPMPVTYGYSMHYNPWVGWGMGVHYSTGWFNFSFYGGYGGYWGPPMYRPPYYPPYHGGIYGGRPPVHAEHYGNINSDRTNNIYNNRNGVSTNDRQPRQGASNPSVATRDQNGRQQPASPLQQPSRTDRSNNVYSDKAGNVYQRDNNGNWNQRSDNQWRETDKGQMDREYQNRQRSAQQNSGFQNMNRGGNMGGNMGGGARMGGGGGRRH